MKYKVNFKHPVTGKNTLGVIDALDFENNRKKSFIVNTTEGEVKIARSDINNSWKANE